MDRKGVNYDVGLVMGANWRPDYNPAVVHRELEIIRTGLHCNTVRIRARDIRRLAGAAEDALAQGLEVWFSPELWNKNPDATLRYITRAAAAAEDLRSRRPGRLVFSVGNELTFFMRGITPGRTFNQRIRGASMELIKSRAYDKPLNAFLARASQAVREIYGGPVTYASLPFEHVDWDMFDLIGVNHYWREPVKDRYLRTLEPLLASGKPVVITELGFRTRTGADHTGPAGPENFALLSWALHLLPLTRPFIRPRVKTIHERNEELQARSLTRQLELLDSAGADGAFVHTFTAPSSPAQTTRDTTSTPTASAWSSPTPAATAPPTRTWPGNRRNRSQPSPATTPDTETASRHPLTPTSPAAKYRCLQTFDRD